MGKTKKRLGVRQSEHFKAISQPNNFKSAVADHFTSTGHNIDWDNFKILTYGKTDYHCKIKETLFIKEMSPAMNGNEGTEPLYLFN